MNEKSAMNPASELYALGVEADNRCSSYCTASEVVFLPVVDKKRRGGPKPLTTGQRLARFWASIQPPNERGCRLWQGNITEGGYGTVYLGKLADGRTVNERAHRVVYRLAHGPIPPGLVVRHKCDTPPCCEDSHLLLGTQGDNVEDGRVQGHYKVERPGRWAVDPAIRPDLIAEALAGPKGTTARLARAHGINERSFMVAVYRARHRRGSLRKAS